jgi:hypothetical protein
VVAEIECSTSFSCPISPLRSWNRSVDIATRLRALKAGVQFPVGGNDFSLLHSVKTGSGAHPASYSMGIEGSPRKESNWEKKVTTHHPIVPK